jgi:hypothetical protein
MNTLTTPRRTTVARLFGAAALAGLMAAPLTAFAVPAQPAAKESPRPHGHRPHDNAVLDWNAVVGEAFAPTQGTNPMAQSRTFAILHASIHDALNAIVPRYAPYTPGLPAAPEASVDAAVAAAAREVLAELLPEQAALVASAYDRTVAHVPDGPARAAGIATGRAAARATIERRRGDRADTASRPAYVPGPGAGDYRFTAPFDFAAMPGWGRVEPFVVDLRQHALDGPQPTDGAAFARDLAEVKAIGHVASRTRTPEQTAIARFWYEDSPLGWNRIANAVVRGRRLDAWDAARAFALVHFAMADGFIAGFDEKYRHRFLRPVTAIRAAATDGNPLTVADPSWEPLLVTPPVPDYPSTHTVLGWAAAEVLIGLFGDRVRYDASSLTLPDVTRRYRSFSRAAEENGMSRLYAGIHFRHAVDAGRRQGRSVGQAVARALAPIH